MEIPSIKSKLPTSDALEFKDMILEPPTANMPVFPPIVIPPGNIKAPAGVELEEAPAEKEETATTEQPTLRVPVVKIDLPLPSAQVVATATYAAVAAVATTTLATPLFLSLIHI